jgi:putative phosphoesterase
MRIAVLADTHDRFPPDLPGRLRDADEIWHLGDVCSPATLVELEQAGPPWRVVLGNGDYDPAWPESLQLERGGCTFLLVHIPPSRTPAGVDVVLHGHTHVPRDETDQLGVRWLNPGCITGPRGAGTSFAWLTIGPEGGIDWRIEKL